MRRSKKITKTLIYSIKIVLLLKTSLINRVSHSSWRRRGRPEKGEPIMVKAEVEAAALCSTAKSDNSWLIFWYGSVDVLCRCWCRSPDLAAKILLIWARWSFLLIYSSILNLGGAYQRDCWLSRWLFGWWGCKRPVEKTIAGFFRPSSRRTSW
jgi:hypothetical protein